jgi:hypothetical protein
MAEFDLERRSGGGIFSPVPQPFPLCGRVAWNRAAGCHSISGKSQVTPDNEQRQIYAQLAPKPLRRCEHQTA